MSKTTTTTDIALSKATQALPDLKDLPVIYDQANEEDRVEIDRLVAEIDVSDTNSIIFFGSKAQEQLTNVSDQMLEGVRNKDAGPAGESLSEMVSTLRGFDVDALDPNRKRSFWARLFGRAKPVVKFLQRYETVGRQIDNITDDLETHKTRLLTDITALDRLYDANLEYFHTLELYIAAGEKKLEQIDTQYLPMLEERAKEGDELLHAQELRDARAARDDLERRVHDLRLTRQVTMQSLPSIRLVQENDKGLVTKINSTLKNTVPLWKQQLAVAVTIYRSGDAAGAVQAASDLTNELLEANAENLKTANADARRQIERGVFDIESVKRSNQLLIDTIKESLEIADEGKKARAVAEQELIKTEAQLRDALAASTASEVRSGGSEGA